MKKRGTEKFFKISNEEKKKKKVFLNATFQSFVHDLEKS